MARPIPHATFLTDLARWIQKNLRKDLPVPTLLGAEPWAPYALVAGEGERSLYVLDRKQNRIARKLPLPPRTRKGTDYRRFHFSADGLTVAAYNSLDSSFAVWSLQDGELVHEAEGVGQIPPAIAFMPGGRIALCDGPKINTYQMGGQRLYQTPVSDDLRSLLLFAPPSVKPVVVGVAVFRKGIGGHHLHSFIVESGSIVGRAEGPYRGRAQRPDDTKHISIHELINIPGSTERILIVSEEERIERRAAGTDWEYDDEYVTRFMAVDPRKGQFYPGEITLPGRHCMESTGTELHVLDEAGRRRRLTAFPLRLEIADWRLQE